MAYVILDSSFISRIRRIDRKCSLISLFADPYGASCVYHVQQYKENPCHEQNATPGCIDLESLIDDDDVLEFSMNHIIDLSKISRDLVDIKIIFFASKESDVILLTCDGNLLEVCQRFSIGHYCFKAALEHLDKYYIGEIFNGQDYDTDLMHDPKGDDPFMHYKRNTRCAPCHAGKNCMIVYK
ncbi:MAG: hypothetical protein HQL65_12270 [Magnetococcales bacterium]|nr:hypothetical protein [Magnetococcales bacterium]